MFSNGMSFGFPPKRYALDAYRTLLQSEVPGAPVMIAGLDVDVSELMADAVDAGIHIRIGLEDAPLFNRNTNVQLVEAAAAKIQRPTATAAEVRSEEHTSELQSLMRISYAVFCLKKKKKRNHH